MSARFYLTYGFNTPDRYHYSVIEAPSWREARDRVTSVRGDKWAFLYTEGSFAWQAERYGLTEVPLCAPT